MGRQGADGARVDVRVRAYASALYGFAASTDADPGRLVAWADEVCAAEQEVMLAGFAPEERAAFADLLARARANLWCAVDGREVR